jgi:putative transcriptional regulator
MVRWRLAELLKEREWTSYRLAKESGLAPPVVYRLATRGREVKRVDGRTLDALCATLEVGPGELLEYIPEAAKRKRGRG